MLHASKGQAFKSVTALSDQYQKKKKKKKKRKNSPKSTDLQNTGDCDRGQCFKIKYTTVEPTTKRWSLKHKICPKFQMVYDSCGVDNIECCSLAVPYTNSKSTELKTVVIEPVSNKIENVAFSQPAAAIRPTSRGPAYTCSGGHASRGTKTPKSSSTFAHPVECVETGVGSATEEMDGTDDGYPQPQPEPSTGTHYADVHDEAVANTKMAAVSRLEVLVDGRTRNEGKKMEEDSEIEEPLTRRVMTTKGSVSQRTAPLTVTTVRPRFFIVSPISKRRIYESRRSRAPEFHRMYDDDDGSISTGNDDVRRRNGGLVTEQTD